MLKDFKFQTEIELIEDESRTLIWLRLFIDSDNDLYIDKTLEYNYILTEKQIEGKITKCFEFMIDKIEDFTNDV